ncbi:MAG: MBG domain-containing protein, partial [Eubacteriales bacterium]|nr:MBG domain-containing protein [Eubacteriales bacterium]
VTVTADDRSKIYGDADPELTYSAEGLVGTDTLTGITVEREAGENAGEYTITASQTEGSNPNYAITLENGLLLIAARDIADADVKLGAALTANGKSQVQSIESVTVKNTAGEELEVTYTVTGNEGTKPGTYSMTIAGIGNFTGTITKEFVIAAAALDSEEEENRGGDTAGDEPAAEPWVRQEAGIAVKEDTESADGESADGETADGTSLQTGDSADSGLWLFAFCISLCMLAGTLFKKRRDEKES